MLVQVLTKLALKTAQLGLTDPKMAAQLLLSHVIKGYYPDPKAWLKAGGKSIKRYALG